MLGLHIGSPIALYTYLYIQYIMKTIYKPNYGDYRLWRPNYEDLILWRPNTGTPYYVNMYIDPIG